MKGWKNMRGIENAIISGLTVHATKCGNVGIIREGELDDRYWGMLLYVLDLGAHQNLRNNPTITISEIDVYGMYDIDDIDNCLTAMTEYYGYIGHTLYDMISYYYRDNDSIHICSPYLQALYHYIALQRNCDAPYADLAGLLDNVVYGGGVYIA